MRKTPINIVLLTHHTVYKLSDNSKYSLFFIRIGVRQNHVFANDIE